MSWEDEDYGHEFANFKEASFADNPFDYDGQVTVLYCEILYDTLNDYINRWNKNRKKVRINNIVLAAGTPYDSDFVRSDGIIWLDMGARLFNAVKKAKDNKWSTVKILKISNPKDKFDVQYYISEYKLKEQKTLDEPVKKQVKGKGKK